MGHQVLKYCIVCLVMLSACNSAKEVSVTDQIDEYLTGQAKHFRFNGNVLVAKNGHVVFKNSYGFADFDTKRLLNDSTVFELASVSKQFTATAILLLMDQGKLKLTDSLRQYFPELPYSNISIRHMLTHTSGLPDYEEGMTKKWDKNKIAFNKDMIVFLANEKLPVLFKPGEKWEYSNTAFALLATIVEKVSGQTFSAFLAENIFRPLQMNHTRIYNTRRSLKDTIPNYAYGFTFSDSLKKYMLPDSLPETKMVIYLDGIQGDGVVNSTTSDLLKWDRAVKSHRLLKEATQGEMLKEQAIVDSATGTSGTGRRSYYGFGVFLENSELGHIVSHSGGWPGYSTNLARNVDKDQTIVVLSNNESDARSITTAIHEILNGRSVEMPYEHKEINIDPLSMQKFAGKYKSAFEMGIEEIGGKLFRVYPSGRKVELRPESTTKFFYADGSDRQIEFETTTEKAKKAYVISHGVRTALDRVAN